MKAIIKSFSFLIALFLCSCAEAQTDGTVLWLGTSIPAGCTYPKESADRLNLQCVNNAIGASFMTLWTEENGFSLINSGLSLTMSSEEKESVFRPYVNRGELTEDLLVFWKSTSYDQLLLPYVKDADIIIIDHGYNDSYSIKNIYDKGKDNIDWTTTDRSDFIGAFNFLYNIIKQNNPSAKIAVGGYFQNTCSIDYFERGKWVSAVSSWIAEKYNLYLLNTWDYTDIPDGYMPMSANYLDSINNVYGKTFKKIFPDSDGNITYFQKFCPDGVHPFSDPTGESNRILDDIFTSLLSNLITNTQLSITNKNSLGYTENHYYDVSGHQTVKLRGMRILIDGNNMRKVLISNF